MCANNNLSILVASPDGTIVLSSAGENSSAVMYVNLLDSMLRMRSSERVLLEESNRYTIERQTDSRMNGDYIVLWGSLEDGNTVLIRSAVESMKDSAEVSNQFLLFVGVGTIIFCYCVHSARQEDYQADYGTDGNLS